MRIARFTRAWIIFDAAKRDSCLPRGNPGDKKSGYLFYRLTVSVTPKGKSTRLKYITCDIADSPIWRLGELYTYDKCRTIRLFARPADFICLDSGGWLVRPKIIN